ncbi:hypothetical protein 2050HW_00319 [Serratia phage vB_SmaM_ 2050HW]|uniref:Uncharacterized protein n=2 Tax=Moabitevirus TaxID=2843422 RepID=A0A7T3NBP2_9CAUD|nr:hypothetical protein HWB23_gp319 [Serratia phage vB_SmaM_ 2050HW]ATA65654.1 hypothetical protein 2050HW_00319 [Serratia phage vB_SmaM_ 2050HW]QPX76770.1 hypothetical protein [Serratia phage vB_SmaM_Yaphecito]UQT03768.1 hypothetical protein KODAMA_03010 [Serratia phage vB_SmaM-Kodama]
MKAIVRNSMEVTVDNTVPYILLLALSPVLGLIAKVTFWSFYGGSSILIFGAGVGLIVHWCSWVMTNTTENDGIPGWLAGVMSYLAVSIGFVLINWGLHLIDYRVRVDTANASIVCLLAASAVPLIRLWFDKRKG